MFCFTCCTIYTYYIWFKILTYLLCNVLDQIFLNWWSVTLIADLLLHSFCDWLFPFCVVAAFNWWFCFCISSSAIASFPFMLLLPLLHLVRWSSSLISVSIICFYTLHMLTFNVDYQQNCNKSVYVYGEGWGDQHLLDYWCCASTWHCRMIPLDHCSHHLVSFGLLVLVLPPLDFLVDLPPEVHAELRQWCPCYHFHPSSFLLVWCRRWKLLRVIAHRSHQRGCDIFPAGLFDFRLHVGLSGLSFFGFVILVVGFQPRRISERTDQWSNSCLLIKWHDKHGFLRFLPWNPDQAGWQHC